MNINSILYVLQELSHFSSFLEESRIKERVLHTCKVKRKGLTKEEIEKRGLNIYEKRGVSIHSILSELIERELIEIEWLNINEEKNIRLSQNGLAYLMELYTDNYSVGFLEFKEKIADLTERLNETNLNPLHIAGYYWNRKSVDYIESVHFTIKRLKEEAKNYHHYLLSKYEKEFDSETYVFHINPQLFLPVDDWHEEVRLSVEGIDITQPIIIGKPYNNKRYAVAGTKIGKEKLFTGFYPIVAPINEFPKEKRIILHWEIGGRKEIVHEIDIQFQFDRGFLFSTYQTLMRSNDLPYINLTTITENIGSLRANRNMEFIEEGENVLRIKEKVTLTSFPIHNHSSFLGNRSFQEWREKRDK